MAVRQYQQIPRMRICMEKTVFKDLFKEADTQAAGHHFGINTLVLEFLQAIDLDPCHKFHSQHLLSRIILMDARGIGKLVGTPVTAKVVIKALNINGLIYKVQLLKDGLFKILNQSYRVKTLKRWYAVFKHLGNGIHDLNVLKDDLLNSRSLYFQGYPFPIMQGYLMDLGHGGRGKRFGVKPGKERVNIGLKLGGHHFFYLSIGHGRYIVL